MKRVTPLVITVAVAGVCCVVAAFTSYYYYQLHLHTAVQVRGELEWQIRDLGTRLAKLEADKPRHLIPVRASGAVSTTDLPPFDSSASPPAEEEKHELRIVSGKVTRILPEIRLRAGSTAVEEFEIRVEPQLGMVVDGWISHEEPLGSLSSFQKFHLYPQGTNTLKLIIQLKPEASVKMDFGIVVLRHSLWP